MVASALQQSYTVPSAIASPDAYGRYQPMTQSELTPNKELDPQMYSVAGSTGRESKISRSHERYNSNLPNQHHHSVGDVQNVA